MPLAHPAERLSAGQVAARPPSISSQLGRDDSAGAIEAIRKSMEAKRRAGLAPVWPYLALAALAALLARSWVAR